MEGVWHQLTRSGVRVKTTTWEALGVSDSLGAIEAGKIADLVVLSSDPTEDIRASRDIVYVVQAGEVYTPAELLAGSADE